MNAIDFSRHEHAILRGQARLLKAQHAHEDPTFFNGLRALLGETALEQERREAFMALELALSAARKTVGPWIESQVQAGLDKTDQGKMLAKLQIEHEQTKRQLAPFERLDLLAGQAASLLTTARQAGQDLMEVSGADAALFVMDPVLMSSMALQGKPSNTLMERTTDRLPGAREAFLRFQQALRRAQKSMELNDAERLLVVRHAGLLEIVVEDNPLKIMKLGEQCRVFRGELRETTRELAEYVQYIGQKMDEIRRPFYEQAIAELPTAVRGAAEAWGAVPGISRDASRKD